jgi:hypothetical protein
MYSYIIMAMLVAVGYADANASENCRGKNISKFYEQVNISGKNTIMARFELDKDTTLVEIAKQRPNPSIGVEYQSSEENDQDANSIKLSVGHTFELGDKLGARVASALAKQRLESGNTNIRLLRDNFLLAIDYQRIGQLRKIITSKQEAISVFRNIIRKLNKRTKLNPEEMISLANIRLANETYKLSLDSLKNQLKLTSDKLIYNSSCNPGIISYSPIEFPKRILVKSNSTDTGMEKIEDYKLQVSELNYDIAKSLGVSDFEIGPTIEVERVNGESQTKIGFGVSFALPLFHKNDGGRANALKKINLQQFRTQSSKKYLERKRIDLIQSYQNSVESLNQMPALEQLEKRHHNLEKLSSRGMVPISLVIESHRQEIDFIKARFDKENEILTTGLSIALIDGNGDILTTILKDKK